MNDGMNANELKAALDTTYPPEVQKYINALDRYAVSDTLEKFTILHLYPQEIAAPNGYYDSRFFELWGFNPDAMQKRNLGRHDGLDIEKGARVDMVRIFADGSTLIRFPYPVRVQLFQSATVEAA